MQSAAPAAAAEDAPPLASSALVPASPSTIAPSLRAIITLVTSDDFIVGASVLSHSLRAVGTRHPLYVLITPDLSADSRAALAAAGWHLLLVPALAHANANTHVQSWADVGYTKLRVWQLTQFSRLLYIDADCVVKQNVDHLLAQELDGISFAAAPDTFPPDKFNAGVMLLRPCARVFAAMLRRMSCTPSYDGGDTGFLNLFFTRWWNCGSAISSASDISLAPDLASRSYRESLGRLSFGYNALRTMQWFTKKAPLYWQAIQPLHIVHYCSSPKPWQDMEARRGGHLEQLWFETYDAMKLDADAQSARAASGPSSSIALEFVAAPHGGLVPSDRSQHSVQTMQPFQALQTMLAAQIEQMPFAEFKWKHSESAAATEAPPSSGAAPAAAASPSDAVTAAYPPSGAVRPLTRGVWVSPEREDAFLTTARASLHAAVLDSLQLHSESPCRRTRTGIPKRVHQIWIGGELPAREKEWCKSWQQHHPPECGWEYRLWTDADLPLFPLCERLTDAASSFLAAHLRALLPRCTNPAQMSDLLRLDILWTEGGVYVDTDFESLAALSPLHEGGVWAGAVEFYTGLSNVGVVEINNGLIAAVPQHPLIGKLLQGIEIEACTKDRPQHTAMQIIRTSGPGWFTQVCVRFIEEWREKHAAAIAQQCAASSSPTSAIRRLCSPSSPPLLFFPPQVFYPLPNSMRHLRSAEDKAHFYTPATFAVHHWACSWLPKNVTPEAAIAAVNDAAKREKQAAQLIALAQALQQAPAPAPAKVAHPATAAAALDSTLLAKIAGFMK